MAMKKRLKLMSVLAAITLCVGAGTAVAQGGPGSCDSVLVTQSSVDRFDSSMSVAWIWTINESNFEQAKTSANASVYGDLLVMPQEVV